MSQCHLPGHTGLLLGLQMCPVCAARCLCSVGFVCLILAWLTGLGSDVSSDRANLSTWTVLLPIPCRGPVSSICCHHFSLSLFIPFSSPQRKCLEGKDFCLLCSVLYLQGLKQCLFSDGCPQGFVDGLNALNSSWASLCS